METTVFLLAISSLLLLIKCWQYRNIALHGISSQESDSQRRVLADAVCEGYFDVDLTTGSYVASDNFYKSTGYTQADLPDQFTEILSQFIHPADIDNTTAIFNNASKSGVTDKIIADFRFRHASGHWIWIHGGAELFFDDNAVPVRLVAAFTDISAVKKNEQIMHNGQVLAGLREYRFDATNHTVAFGPEPLSNNQPSHETEWIYQPTADITHPEDLAMVIQAIEQAGANNQPLEIEFRIFDAAGQIRNIVLYGTTEADVNGTVLAATGVFRDITDQKHTESRYIELGKLLEGSRTGLIITRIRDLSILFVNQKYCSDSGFSFDEVVGNPCTDFITDWSFEQVRELFSPLTDMDQETENWAFQAAHMYKKDGSSYPNDAWVQLTEWEGEQVVATILVDISDRVEAEQALRQSEEKYRQLFDALPDGVLLLKESELTIIDCNRELATSHGWSLDELRGQHISVLITPRDRHRQGDALTAITNNPRTVVQEAMNIRKDKSEFPVEAHVKAITLHNAPYIVTVVRDVTERHHYIKELKQQKAEIEQFTYSISHDLKSPLVTIEGFSEILAENLATNDLENAQSDLRRINKAASKMHVLLTELLEYSRLGITPHSTTPTAMNDIVEDALERVAGQVLETSAQITVAPDLPTVNGNPDRLAQVYQNLIDNSIKFRHPDRPIEIELGWDPEKNCFFVDDNGRGIELQFQNKVFALFDQLDPEQPGSGIGLATVKRIIDTHEGKIWVESPSALGGTKISFFLPNLLNQTPQ